MSSDCRLADMLLAQAMAQHLSQRLAQAAAQAPSSITVSRTGRSRAAAASRALPAAGAESPAVQLGDVQDVVAGVLGASPDPEQPLMQVSLLSCVTTMQNTSCLLTHSPMPGAALYAAGVKAG